MSTYLVDPSSKLPWSHDWASWLSAGDSIASRVWTISPAGPTLTNETTDTVTAESWASGKTYRLAEKVTTANGAIGERSIIIRVADR